MRDAHCEHITARQIRAGGKTPRGCCGLQGQRERVKVGKTTDGDSIPAGRESKTKMSFAFGEGGHDDTCYIRNHGTVIL